MGSGRVLAAYADMAAPWKELLDYYQQKEDMTIRFQRVVGIFHRVKRAKAQLTTTVKVPPPSTAIEQSM